MLRNLDRRRPGALTPSGLQKTGPLRLEFTAAAAEAVSSRPPGAVIAPSAAAPRATRRPTRATWLGAGIALVAAVAGPPLARSLTGAERAGSRSQQHLASRATLAAPPLVPPSAAIEAHPRAAAAQGQPREVFPFRPHGHQRVPTAADGLPSLYADGLACSVGCRPLGAVSGWPLRPFHGQHALRAGLNERRDQSLHKGLDIQAHDGARVYAMQPGRAHIIQRIGPDSRVQVGNYIYWHVVPGIAEGTWVRPYRTVIGRLKPHAFGHLHLSEVTAAGAYLNPLRPGGRVLSPWGDSERPVIGRPRFRTDGSVLVRAFDPQSFHLRTTYKTPVLAPAGLAYRVFDPRGHAVTTLRWALRSTRVFPYADAREIYAPDARQPGFSCFATRAICKPNWDYNLAGGLAPRLTSLLLPAGRYRLSVYAWDYAGNVTARDAHFTISSSILSSHVRRALSLTVVRG